jgi:hypothetical protein
MHSRLINTFVDSLWLTLVHHLTSIPIDPVTNFNLVLANTASAPVHTCQSNCLTAYALVCRCIPCLSHTSPLFSCQAFAILTKIHRVANPHHLRPHCRQPYVISDRCRVPRIPQTLYIPVRANLLLAFPLTRLRLSGCLRRSPSISLSRIHQNLAPPSTWLHGCSIHLRPVDFKLSWVHLLNQPRALVMSKHTPLWLAPRVSTPQNSDTIRHHAPTSLCADPHRLLYPSDCLVRPSRTYRPQPWSTSRNISPNTVMHYLTPFGTWSFTTYSHVANLQAIR